MLNSGVGVPHPVGRRRGTALPGRRLDAVVHRRGSRPSGASGSALRRAAGRRSEPPQIDDIEAAVAEFEAGLPGLPGYMEPDAPGMHTTDTIDFEVILDGEVWLELDDGVEVHLKPGDTVVQNGTRHAWRNHGDQVCRIAVFLIGAHHDKVTRPT